MKSNNYMLFPNHTLEVLHFLMKETLSTMTSQHSILALSRGADLNTYHNAVQVLHNEFIQINEAMEERAVVPIRGKINNNPESDMTPSEIHY